MDGNNWRPAQGELNMDGTDWRTQLSSDSRQRIVNKIMETLKRHLPISGPDGLVELEKIAVRFEEKIHTASTSLSDYLRKISLKMLTMENKSQNSVTSLPSNSGGNQNPSDPASQGLQSQVRNPGQSLAIPIGNQSQPRQQLLPQNLQNTIASAAVQNSPSLQPALLSVTGLNQTSMSNVVGQNSNLHTMSGISQNSVNNLVGQGVPSNMFSNSQRQMQGRQHPQQVIPQQHQQQSQNPQQFFQQQFQQQMMKQKLLQGNMQPSLLQSHMQQQQPNQMQPSQQSLMQMSSGLQSSQATLQQIQPSMIKSAPQSGLQQNHLQKNQQSSVQQSGPSGLQQHPQLVLRQQQQSQQSSVHQQTSVLHQQQTPINQQPILPSQQQQQLMAQQHSATNMQQNQLLAQQNSVPDMHQQQMLLNQQNNLSNMQQQHQQQLLCQQNKNLHQPQQLGQQSNVSGLQQQQFIGSQPGPGVSNMQQHQHSVNMLQQTKVAAQQQQQAPQQISSTLLSSQGQQSQSQPPPQQLMSQSQPAQLQQQQQQPNTLQQEMQQRIQTSSALLQPQNAIEQQKQLFQRPLPEASSTSMDSTAQTGHAGVVDWQEEIYQKIKSMKESYLPELSEMSQKITMKCQQNEALGQQPKQSDQIEKLKSFKTMLERMKSFLQMPKNSISPAFKEKLSSYEKYIVNFLNLDRFKKPASSQQPGQQQLQQSVGQSNSMTHQPQSQITQLQQHDNLVNPMQPMNMQGSVTSMLSTAVTSLQHGSMPLSTHMGVPATQQNMMNALQTGSNLESASGHALSSLPQGVVGSLQQNAMASLQQNTINAAQQPNFSTLSQNSMNQLQSNVNSLQPNSNILQQQHLKQQQQQEQQLMQSQQLKQQNQQSHMIQQLFQQKQQILQQQQQQQQQPQLQQQFQQQQLHQQQKQQQSSQLQAQQIPLHQMNEVNESKVRPGATVKPGLFPQPHPAGQRPTTYHQQLKTGAAFPISSPQLLQAASPQLSQHSSPQIDQQSLLSTLPKAGTPLQSVNSPFIGTSPSTPVAPSPIPGDSEKQPPAISSITNAGNVGHQQTAHGLTQAQSLAIGTPGISASPLLAEFTSLDGNQNAPTNISGKSSTTDRPLERLIKVVRSMSPKAFRSSVSDIGSVVSMTDRIAGSAPGNGSRAAVGEDLVAMTKCRMQARNFMSHDGSATMKKMRRHTSAMPLNTVSSAGSVNDSFKQLSYLETSELESTATSRIKRHRAEANHSILEEVREINQRLIDTVVEISDEDVDSIAAAAEGEGTVVKCSFNAVALSPNLKSQFDSAQMSPILPMRLLVPANYPNCSPILLDKLLVEPSKEFEDLSVKAKLSFSIDLRVLSHPISLGEMARTWDVCARKVIADYAHQSGGGSFSSRYGAWENCVSA